MYSLRLVNNIGASIKLTQNESNYQIVNISGLNPPTAEVYTTPIAFMDGGKYKSSKVQMRNVVIIIRLNGAVEANRLLLYSICRIGGFIRVYYENGSRSVYVDGYIENIDNEFTATVGVEPSEFGYYLNACHYTDNQIKRYFDSLKAKGLYDSSLIVIVADHHVSENQLELPPIINERELPVFIINGGFSTDEAWHGQCNQLDVFTTILDILNIDSEWRGLGHTLLNPHYKNSLTEAGYNYSEWIILSDYFKN